jgi:cytochrome b561
VRWRNTKSAYGVISKGFHWGLAGYVLGMLVFGKYLVSIKVSLATLYLFGLHKAFGILAFSLIGLRLLWTLSSHPPVLLSAGMSGGALLLARVVHWGLYAAMVAMPVTGWIASSAAGFEMSFFGLFTIPALTGANPGVEAFFFEVHGYIADTLIGLLALHIAGALLRHFFHKDQTLRRMWF